MDGKALKLRRVAADIRNAELAKAMATTPANISRIENSRRVTARAQERYLAALTLLTGEASDGVDRGDAGAAA